MDKQHTAGQIILRWLVLAMTLFGLPLSSLAELRLPADHHASYIIEKHGSEVGQMQTRLHHQQQQVVYHSTTRASGIAALFIREDFQEDSVLAQQQVENQSVLRQQRFTARRGEKHKQNQDIHFAWNGQNTAHINGRYREHDYRLECQQPVWSRHLLPLLMSSDLLQNPSIRNNQFTITDKGELQRYSYTLLKNEDIEIDGELYTTQKFILSREGSDRISYVWLSKQHQYLPLKIEQYQDGELNVNMVLSDFKTA